jgi:hypothetical protein
MASERVGEREIMKIFHPSVSAMRKQGKAIKKEFKKLCECAHSSHLKPTITKRTKERAESSNEFLLSFTLFFFIVAASLL